MVEKIIIKEKEDGVEKTIENDNIWTSLPILRWKYIAEATALIIISHAIITYTYLDKSLPNWFKIITIMSCFWVFFPSLYENYIKSKKK